MPGVQLGQVVFWRSLIPALALLPWVVPELRRDWPSIRPRLTTLGLRGLLGGSAMVLYFLAIDRVDLSVAVILTYTSPIWAALLAWLFLGEGGSWRLFASFVCGFAGVGLVSGVAPVALDPLGVVAGLLAGLCAGAAYVAVRGLSGQVSTSVIVFSFSLVTTLGSAPWGLASIPDAAWPLLALAGLFGCIAQILMTEGYKLNTAARGSVLNLATVATTSIGAYLFLGERLANGQVVGLALVALSVLGAGSEREAGDPIEVAPAGWAPHGEAADR